MEIVVAGAGEVGSYLAKMLYNSKHNITVIDTDDERLSFIASHFDVFTVKGSATSLDVLREAKVGKADLFIGVTEMEEVNIISSVLAKRLNVKKTVARINNPEYLRSNNWHFFEGLGIDNLVYPEILASSEIINLLKQSGTTKVFEFSGGRLSLFAIKLEAGAPILNKTLEEVVVDNQAFNYRAVAIRRNGVTIIPHGSDYFLKGDLAYVITNQAGISNLMKYSGKKQVQIKDVMILGGSRVGKKTAQSLGKHINVKLLEINKEKSFELADSLDNTLVVNADGRNIEVLREEGIAGMDAFIAVTGNSETNIISCIAAKKLGVKKTIAEIENMDYIDLAEQMGIDTIINKKRIAASTIFGLTMSAEVTSVQCLNGTDAEILEFVVHKQSKITKGKLCNVKFPKGAIIGGVTRGKSSFIAKGDTEIHAKDRVVVFALPHAIENAGKFFL